VEQERQVPKQKVPGGSKSNVDLILNIEKMLHNNEHILNQIFWIEPHSEHPTLSDKAMRFLFCTCCLKNQTEKQDRCKS